MRLQHGYIINKYFYTVKHYFYKDYFLQNLKNMFKWRMTKKLTVFEKAIQHFSNESEVLKGEYETFVNNYLHKNSNKH